MKKKIYAFLYLSTFVPLFCFGRFDVTFDQGKLKPSPIAILPFQGDSNTKIKLPEVIGNDLQHSGFFENISEAAFIETGITPGQTPRFGDWRLIKARLLLSGTIAIDRNDMMTVRFQLWDIYSEQSMLTGTLKADKRYARRLAHIIANLVYKRITGSEGYFDSRVVYIAEKGPQMHRKKRLALMDYDGANHQYLTDKNVFVISPRFSPTEQKIIYVMYENRNKPGKIRLLNLETGTDDFLKEVSGITYAPRFSPDGMKVVFSRAYGGKSCLYLLDTQTKELERLTNEEAIDTSPCFDPTGKKIVFNSDRGGKKQLYIMDLGNKNIERVSFGGGVYATPSWAPNGKWIAFTKIEKGQFYIGIMQPDGTHERLISSGYLVEGPSWAPDSRTLCFYRQEPWDKTGTKGGKARVYSVDISGANQVEMPTPMDATDPSWSPPLPFTHTKE